MSLAHDDCGLVPGRTMATNAELMEEINRARVPEYEGLLPGAGLLRKQTTDSSLQDKIRFLAEANWGEEGDSFTGIGERPRELPREDSFEMARFLGVLQDLEEEQKPPKATMGNLLNRIKDGTRAPPESVFPPHHFSHTSGNGSFVGVGEGRNRHLMHSQAPMVSPNPWFQGESGGIASYAGLSNHGGPHSQSAMSMDASQLPPKLYEVIAPHLGQDTNLQNLMGTGPVMNCENPQILQGDYPNGSLSVKASSMGYKALQASQSLKHAQQMSTCFPINSSQSPIFGSDLVQQSVGFGSEMLGNSAPFMQPNMHRCTAGGMQGYSQPIISSMPPMGMGGCMSYSEGMSGVTPAQHSALACSNNFADSVHRVASGSDYGLDLGPSSGYQVQDHSMCQDDLSGSMSSELAGVVYPNVNPQTGCRNLPGWPPAAHTDLSGEDTFQYNMGAGCTERRLDQVLSSVPGSSQQASSIPHGIYSMNPPGYRSGLCDTLMGAKVSSQMTAFQENGQSHECRYSLATKETHSSLTTAHNGLTNQQDSMSVHSGSSGTFGNGIGSVGHRVCRSHRVPEDSIGAAHECPRKVLRRNTAGEGHARDRAPTTGAGTARDGCSMDHVMRNGQGSQTVVKQGSPDEANTGPMRGGSGASVEESLAALQEGVTSQQDLAGIMPVVAPGARDEAMEAELQTVNFDLRVERAEKKIEQHNESVRLIDEQVASGVLDREQAKALRRQAYNRREAAASRARKDKELRQTVMQKQKLEKVEHQLRELLVSSTPLSLRRTSTGSSKASLKRSSSSTDLG